MPKLNSPKHLEMSSHAWRDFLIEQTLTRSDYFNDPNSAKAMIYFKEMLELICERAIHKNSCSGIHSFITAIKNDRVKHLIHTWLDTYSPIRQVKNKDGIVQNEVIRDYTSRCSIANAKLNPYFTLEPKPRKVHIFRRQNFVTSTSEVETIANTKVLFNTSRAAVSDFDLSVKLAKIAFNDFIRERSLDSRKKLIEKINSIHIGAIETKGNFFLQGVAPGLGKK